MGTSKFRRSTLAGGEIAFPVVHGRRAARTVEIVRRMSIAIVVSLGVHAGSAWALRAYGPSPAPATAPAEPAEKRAAEPDPPDAALVTGLSFTVEDAPAELGAPGDADGADATPAARREQLREARERSAERRARQLARAADAHRDAARAKVRLRASELEVEAWEAKIAVKRDQSLTTEGRLRIARAPVAELAVAAVAAEAAVARTEQEAEVAEARAEATAHAEAAAAPPPPRAKGKEAAPQQPKPPADVAMNAAIARANAARQQAEDAKANAEAARRRHEASAAALAPLAAAAAADAAALQEANAALARAEAEVVLAAAALQDATARSEREATRALAELQAPALDPAEWVKLPGAPPPPSPPGAPAPPSALAAVEAGAGAPQPTNPDTTPPGGAPLPAPAAASPVTDSRPAAVASALGPEPPRPQSLPGSPTADALAPLTYVRTEGGPVAAWDPDARVIGTNALAALVAMRAPVNVAPLEAIGPGQAPEAPLLAPAPDADRAPPLPPLRSDGPAADGFVLSLLDAPSPPPPPPAVEEPTPGGGDTSTAPAHVESEPDADPSLVDASADAIPVLPDSVPEGSATLISVSGHPLAGWMDGVDEALRRGWDYPAELQARGLSGSVEVGFRVSPSGRVSNVKVLRSDAPPELVLAATSSVPARFKPPPAGWGDIDIRYTYRYRGGP